MFAYIVLGVLDASLHCSSGLAWVGGGQARDVGRDLLSTGARVDQVDQLLRR